MPIHEGKPIRRGPAGHPDKRELERFMRCELPRDEAPAIVRHLLINCPQCMVVTRRLWSLSKRPAAALQILLEEAARQERGAARHKRRLLEADGR